MVESIPKERWDELDFSEWNESDFPIGDIFGIVENGEIVAWYCVERNQTHVGPFRVKDSRQGRLGGLLIKDAMQRTAKETIYVAAVTEESKHLCEKAGMTQIDGTLYTRGALG